jgi:mRNA-degrading endonuclease toxin of MazEF toxin-antitoxin module
MADPGDVVTVDFHGATGPKRRPAVVVSSALYHQHRPDLVLGVLTSQGFCRKFSFGTPLGYDLPLR